MKRHEPGQMVGCFEIIEKLPNTLAINGTWLGRYKVRCPVCGNTVELLSNKLRYRRDCGCQSKLLGERISKTPPRTRSQCWMSDGEIYRAWKEMRNRREGVRVLAELNDVPQAEIRRIISEEALNEECEQACLSV